MPTLLNISTLFRTVTWPLTGQLPTKLRLENSSNGYVSADMPFMNIAQTYAFNPEVVSNKLTLITSTSSYTSTLQTIAQTMSLGFNTLIRDRVLFLSNTFHASSSISAIQTAQLLNSFVTYNNRLLFISSMFFTSGAITNTQPTQNTTSWIPEHSTIYLKAIQTYKIDIVSLDVAQAINLGINYKDILVLNNYYAEVNPFSFNQTINYYTGNALLEIQSIYNVIRNKFAAYFNTAYSVLIGPELTILYDANMTCLAVFHAGYSRLSADITKFKDSSGLFLLPEEISAALAGYEFSVFDNSNSKLHEFSFSSLNFTGKDVYYLDNTNISSDIQLTSIGSTIYVIPNSVKGNALLDSGVSGFICQINDIKLLPSVDSYEEAKSSYLSDILYPIQYTVEKYIGINSEGSCIVQCRDINSNSKHILSINQSKNIVLSLLQYSGSDILLLDGSEIYFAENIVEFQSISDYNSIKKFNFITMELSSVAKLTISYTGEFKAVYLYKDILLWILYRAIDNCWYLSTIDNKYEYNLTSILSLPCDIIDYSATSKYNHYFILANRTTVKFDPYSLISSSIQTKGIPLKLIPMR